MTEDRRGWAVQATDPEDWDARRSAAFMNRMLDDPEAQRKLTEAAKAAYVRWMLYGEQAEWDAIDAALAEPSGE